MTVTYTAEVATTKGFGCFIKLLRRWRGSIYKIIWLDLIIFLSAYYALNLLHRFVLDEHGRYIFQCVAHYCYNYISLIPLSFVLGFYVAIVMKRWWDQYITMPWPDPLAVYVSSLVHGQDDHGRVMRRTVMRYVCLCFTMVLTMIAPGVKKRFPTLEHLVEAGFLIENEMVVIRKMQDTFPKHPNYWMPIVWATSIMVRARKEGRIRDDISLNTIIEELNQFREMCMALMHYDSISVPLVYTQVVTLVVYAYFVGVVMGRQWAEQNGNTMNFYFPVFTVLEFFFYMGWLKVAESLIWPFGEDDDDFELNWMIDRNLQVSYLIVDEMHHEHPELVKDQYWDEVFPNELPYANEGDIREEPPEHSTKNLEMNKSQDKMERQSFIGAALKQLMSRDDKNRATDLQPFSVSSSRSEIDIGGISVVQDLYGQPTVNKNVAVSEITPVRISQSEISTTIRSTSEMRTAEDDSIEKDQFEQLKEERERERLERQQRNLARTVDNVTNAGVDLSRKGSQQKDVGENPTDQSSSVHSEKENLNKEEDDKANEDKQN